MSGGRLTDKHILIWLKVSTKQGECKTCGLVNIIFDGKDWRCGPYRAQQKRDARKRKRLAREHQVS